MSGSYCIRAPMTYALPKSFTPGERIFLATGLEDTVAGSQFSIVEPNHAHPISKKFHLRVSSTVK